MLNVKDKHCFLSLQKKKPPQTHLKQKNMEILDKVLIKANTLLEITRENIAMRGSIPQEERAILNLHIPNNNSLKLAKANRMTRKNTFTKSPWQIFFFFGQSTQHVGSLTRDHVQALCTGSAVLTPGLPRKSTVGDF